MAYAMVRNGSRPRSRLGSVINNNEKCQAFLTNMQPYNQQNHSIATNDITNLHATGRYILPLSRLAPPENDYPPRPVSAPDDSVNATRRADSSAKSHEHYRTSSPKSVSRSGWFPNRYLQSSQKKGETLINETRIRHTITLIPTINITNVPSDLRWQVIEICPWHLIKWLNWIDSGVKEGAK